MAPNLNKTGRFIIKIIDTSINSVDTGGIRVKSTTITINKGITGWITKQSSLRLMIQSVGEEVFFYD